IGTNFPDALSIGPIAAANDMPLLLVPPNDLTYSQKVLVVSNKIPASYIVTGNSELSNKVIAQFPNYEIIDGADPYERNIKLIMRFADSLDLDTVYVATGEIFADALASSALASKSNHPVLLLQGDTVSNMALSFIGSNVISKLNIMGGTSVISASTESLLVSKPAQIASVTDIIDSVQEGDPYTPPKTVSVTTTNGLKEEVPVTWSLTSVYSLRAGIYEFEGKIKNYSNTVHLRLTITPIWNKITAETVQNGSFNFPQTVEVPMGNNVVKSLPITWKTNLVNINNIGTYTFEGTVPDLNQIVTLTLKVSEDSQIYFPDPALKTAVCRTLGKPTDATIYKSDVLNISSLYYNNSGITDLTGLEYFTNLKTLYLGGNNLTITTPLIALTNLKCLELRNCGLKDLNSLTGLTSLTSLDIASNNINDFSPLRQLTNLTSLYLSNNNTLDYSPVRLYYKNLVGKDFYL
ncbi:MAG: Ig-like domain-containing protein, partial [Bacillota bacterium]|nr:Ig-like domain-containing protein [Bacillota bacterium]